MEFLRSAPRTDLHVSVSQIKCFQMCPKNCAQSALMRTPFRIPPDLHVCRRACCA